MLLPEDALHQSPVPGLRTQRKAIEKTCTLIPHRGTFLQPLAIDPLERLFLPARLLCAAVPFFPRLRRKLSPRREIDQDIKAGSKADWGGMRLQHPGRRKNDSHQGLDTRNTSLDHWCWTTKFDRLAHAEEESETRIRQSERLYLSKCDRGQLWTKKEKKNRTFFPQTKIVSIEISEKRGRKKKEKEMIPSANEFTSELMSASSIGTKSALIWSASPFLTECQDRRKVRRRSLGMLIVERKRNSLFLVWMNGD